mgnify:CR=1 FL=1|jgi:hypothetical protein
MDKKAVAWFWWILIVLFGIVVFMGVYLLVSGKNFNDFLEYTQNTGSETTSQAGVTPVSDSGQDISSGDNSNETSDTLPWEGWGNLSQSNYSSSLSDLPPPPTLPS